MRARNAQVYAEGESLGIEWGELDLRDNISAAPEVELLRAEAQSEVRWQRAFYLGALRGYRSIARTLKDGRWGL